MTEEQKRVLHDLRDCGIAKTNVFDFLDEEGIQFYNNTLQFLKKHAKSPERKKQIKSFLTDKPIKGKNKWFELGTHDLIGRGCALEDDNAIPLYLRPEFLDIAEGYHENENCRLRNVLTWIHPATKIKKNTGSMMWHRDTENRRVCKVFIYYNEITADKGALNYTKHSRVGEKHHHLHPQENPRGNGYLSIEAKAQIPEEDIVIAEGKAGDIYFVDTYGFHRGGNIKHGIRLLTQGNFLPIDAEQIQRGPLYTFDWGAKSKRKLVYNLVNWNGPKYQNLSDRQKNYLASYDK